MTFYFDAENMHQILLPSEISAGDRLLILYSKQSLNLDYEGIEAAKQRGVMVETIFCDCGYANAVDFQLVFLLAEEMSKSNGGSDSFGIISCDRGYTALSRMVEERGFKLHFYNVASGEIEESDSLLELANTVHNENCEKKLRREITKIIGFANDENTEKAEKLLNFIIHCRPNRRSVNKYIYSNFSDVVLRKKLFTIVNWYYRTSTNVTTARSEGRKKAC